MSDICSSVMVSTLVVFLSLGVVELVTVMATLLSEVITVLSLNQLMVGAGIPEATQSNCAVPFL